MFSAIWLFLRKWYTICLWTLDFANHRAISWLKAPKARDRTRFVLNEWFFRHSLSFDLDLHVLASSSLRVRNQLHRVDGLRRYWIETHHIIHLMLSIYQVLLLLNSTSNVVLENIHRLRRGWVTRVRKKQLTRVTRRQELTSRCWPWPLLIPTFFLERISRFHSVWLVYNNLLNQLVWRPNTWEARSPNEGSILWVASLRLWCPCLSYCKWILFISFLGQL